MSAINSAPKIIEDRAEKELALPPREILKRVCSAEIATSTSCKLDVAISLFFDGTNNNMQRDEVDLSHSNIVRLFKSHKSTEGKNALLKSGAYKVYIPGVGTRFEANDELRETADGKAMAKGGQARILYALLHTYNAVYKAIPDYVSCSVNRPRGQGLAMSKACSMRGIRAHKSKRRLNRYCISAK